jgi:hypothetical protein
MQALAALASVACKPFVDLQPQAPVAGLARVAFAS